MRLLCDNDGFPLLELPEQNIVLGALPFSKWQYEKLWARAGCLSNTTFNDACYENWLRLNPRSTQQSDSDSPLHFWLTGLTPFQARELLVHLGALQLPDAQTWLNVEKHLSQQPFTALDVRQWKDLGLCEFAKRATSTAWRQRAPKNWAQALLLQDGILEWAAWNPPAWSKDSTGIGALGSPLGTSFVPQIDGPRRHDATDQPTRWHGFRVWKSL